MASVEPAPPPATAGMRDVPLGTLIFRAGLLAEEQLEDALQEGMRTGKRLGEVLAERGLIRDSDLGRLLAGQQGLPYVEIGTVAVDPAARQLLPDSIARMQNALVFALEDGVPVVAVADPTNELVIENVKRALGAEPRLVVAAHGELARRIDEAYSAVDVQAPAPVTEAPPVVPPPAAPVEQVVNVEQQAGPPAAPAPMPTVVPPPEERTPDRQPEVPQAPVLAAPAAPAEVPPLHAQAAVEAPLAPEAPPPPPPAVTPSPEPVAVVPPEPAVVPAAPAVVPAAPAVAPAESAVVPAEPALAPPAVPHAPAEPGLFVQAAEAALAPPPENPMAPADSQQAPAPQPEPPAAPAPTPAAEVSPTHFVVLRLTGGDHVEIGGFPSQDEAESFARTVVGRITRAEEQAEWPLFSDRFLRPQTIVSVDVLEQPVSAWMGSSARRASMAPPSA